MPHKQTGNIGKLIIDTSIATPLTEVSVGNLYGRFADADTADKVNAHEL